MGLKDAKSIASVDKNLAISIVCDVHEAVLIDGYPVRILQLPLLLLVLAEPGDKLPIRPEHADALLVGVGHIQHPLLVTEAQGAGTDELERGHEGVVGLKYLDSPGDARPADVEQVFGGGRYAHRALAHAGVAQDIQVLELLVEHLHPVVGSVTHVEPVPKDDDAPRVVELAQLSALVADALEVVTFAVKLHDAVRTVLANVDVIFAVDGHPVGVIELPPLEGGQPLPVLVPYSDQARGVGFAQNHVPFAVEGDPVRLVQPLDHPYRTPQLSGRHHHKDGEGGSPQGLPVHLDRHVVLAPRGGHVLCLVELVPGEGHRNGRIGDEGEQVDADGGLGGAGGEGRELKGGGLSHLNLLHRFAGLLPEVQAHGGRAESLEVVDGVDVRLDVGRLAGLQGDGRVSLNLRLDLRDELLPDGGGSVLGLDGLGDAGGEGGDATQGVPEGPVLLREGGQLLLHYPRQVLEQLLPPLLQYLDHVVKGVVQLRGDGAGLLRNLPPRPVHVGDGGLGRALDDGQRLRLLGHEIGELGHRGVSDVIVAVVLVVAQGALGAHQLHAVPAEKLQLEVVARAREDRAGGLRAVRIFCGLSVDPFRLHPL